jgi:hypothetical protein
METTGEATICFVNWLFWGLSQPNRSARWGAGRGAPPGAPGRRPGARHRPTSGPGAPGFPCCSFNTPTIKPPTLMWLGSCFFGANQIPPGQPQNIFKLTPMSRRAPYRLAARRTPTCTTTCQHAQHTHTHTHTLPKKTTNPQKGSAEWAHLKQFAKLAKTCAKHCPSRQLALAMHV